MMKRRKQTHRKYEYLNKPRHEAKRDMLKGFTKNLTASTAPTEATKLGETDSPLECPPVGSA